MIRSDSTNGTASVRRTIIAGIWVAFFQECQQSSWEQEQAYFDFSLAVFLMFAEKYSYYAAGLHGKDAWCGPLCFPWFPAYDRPLGAPLGPAVAVGTDS